MGPKGSSRKKIKKLTSEQASYIWDFIRKDKMKNKYTIQMDFEGMQEALQPYDGLIIEADSEAEAEKIILKKIKDDCVSPLPYFAISED